MKKLLFLLTVSFVSLISSAQEEVYELRTYQLNSFKSADLMHSYFKDALIPALNRQGVESVGVFEEQGQSLPPKIYMVIPYPSIEAFQSARLLLDKDEKYQIDGAPYLNISIDEVPFEQLETSLIQSSYGFPELQKPSEASTVYELRIYPSHTEDGLRRKLDMFDQHEFPIFADAGLPMVFFGVNLAGGEMPCLTYMLASKDMQAHEEGWEKFFEHPEWQRITKLDKYQNTMNNLSRVYLKPVDYSQF